MSNEQVKRNSPSGASGGDTSSRSGSGKSNQSPEIPKSVLTLIGIVLVFLLLAGYFIWPTPWQYYDSGGTRYRQSRWSGHNQVYLGDHWTDS